ncbi:MAG: dihydrofolate reductase [Bacteroidales bacterium]|nr:dihydrofolate reductase [Bacteroidales bacterium]
MTSQLQLPKITIIVAQDEDRGIGRNNDLMWHISADLRRFKQLTTGHTVIMGRRTWQSLPNSPLPNRRNIVLTRQPDFVAAGAEVAHSAEQLLPMLDPTDEAFVIGGASIYAELMPFASHIRLTQVYHRFKADVFFPPIDRTSFHRTAQSECFTDPQSGLEYAFIDFERTDKQ